MSVILPEGKPNRGLNFNVTIFLFFIGQLLADLIIEMSYFRTAKNL